MKKIITITIITFLVLISFEAFAQTANLSIQGVLRTAEGDAVENGDYDLTFKLYTAPTTGNPVWEENIEGVNVKGGIYSIILGAGDTPLNATFDQPYFLGVSVEGGVEMIPRAKLTSSPYALSLIGNDNVFPNSGNVGVGSATPQSKLTIARGDGVLGLEAEETAGNTAVITTTSEGMSFNPGGTEKDFDFQDGDLKLNNGNIALENGSFVFSDETNIPAEVASLALDVTNDNALILSNTIGETQIKGDKVTFNSVNDPVEIAREGEALNLIGSDSTFISFSLESGTNTKAHFGFTSSDTLKLETAGQDFMIDAKGGTTRIMNTLEVGKNGTNSYVQPDLSYIKKNSYVVNEIYGADEGHVDNSAIWAYDDIAADKFKSFSDQRIKKDFRISDPKNDLKTLNQIEITDYRHIDEIKEGSDFRKGFIAQQLKTVFPEAISLSTHHVPNIYALSSEITTDKKNVIITLKKTHGLQVNDNVKVIVEKGEEDLIVESIIDDFSFSIVPQKIVIKDKAFVYGKQVNDFHTVDYDRVFTLAVSATQELINKVEELEKQNAQFLKEQEGSKAELNSLNNRMKVMENLFKMTGSN